MSNLRNQGLELNFFQKTWYLFRHDELHGLESKTLTKAKERLFVLINVGFSKWDAMIWPGNYSNRSEKSDELNRMVYIIQKFNNDSPGQELSIKHLAKSEHYSALMGLAGTYSLDETLTIGSFLSKARPDSVRPIDEHLVNAYHSLFEDNTNRVEELIELHDKEVDSFTLEYAIKRDWGVREAIMLTEAGKYAETNWEYNLQFLNQCCDLGLSLGEIIDLRQADVFLDDLELVEAGYSVRDLIMLNESEDKHALRYRRIVKQVTEDWGTPTKPYIEKVMTTLGSDSYALISTDSGAQIFRDTAKGVYDKAN